MPLASGRPEEVADDEVLQRAITSNSQIAKTLLRPRPSLFSPPPKIREISVNRISGLNEDEVKALADQVAKARGKASSIGYASFTADFPRSLGLETVPAEPPLHHANISGWPEDSDPDEQRKRELQLAKAFCEQATPSVVWES